MNARWLVPAALVLAVLVLTAGTHRRRQMQRRLQDQIYAVDRHVDARIRLNVVTRDDSGTEYLPGKPKLRIVRTHEFGGWIDTKTSPPRLLTNDEKPFGAGRDWYCSEDQERVILHHGPSGSLTLGGMGAGKTTAGVMWLYLRWLENLGTPKCEGAITAPTDKRLDVVIDEIKGTFPASWFHYKASEHMLMMCDGTRIRGISTHRQSASQGSRIQGFNWWFWLGDELQDQLDEFINIQARLRGIGDGSEKRLGTVTAKDEPRWRTFLDQRRDDPYWAVHSMLGPNSPFKHASHWESLRASTTEREYQRLVLAEDLPSESRVYSTFDRKRNIRPIPVGARKVTSIVLSKKTGDRRDAIAIGHDPGAAKAGTVWADAYELPTRKGEILWWVRGELFTLHKTHEQHATEAMSITRNRFGCNVRPDGERAHVRCQPLGQAEDKPDLDVFAIWQRIGFNIKAAQYSKTGQGVGQIKKESRIGVINTLFEKERLFLECDDRGTPATPLLLAAIESMERDSLGRPEHEEKNVRHDKSDLPAALGYLLWPFEKELAMALRADIRRGLS